MVLRHLQPNRPAKLRLCRGLLHGALVLLAAGGCSPSVPGRTESDGNIRGCGDHQCGRGENCQSCPSDCGSCDPSSRLDAGRAGDADAGSRNPLDGSSESGILQADAPATARTRVMPLGDSITLGVNGEDQEGGGYRAPLWRALARSSVDFVGSLANGPSDIDRDHEGHFGWAIPQTRENVGPFLASTHPDVILLHIGTNDVWDHYDDPDQTATALGDLVDFITTEAPSATLIVASILPMYVGDEYNQGVNDYNARIPDVVDHWATQGRKVQFVDINGLTALSPDDFPDKVHPGDKANALMAQVWRAALTSLLDDAE